MELDDFLDKFNLIDRIDRAIGMALSFVPYQPTRKGHPAGALRVAPGMFEISIERGDADQTGGQAERILRKYGIPIWGRRVTSREFIMTVRARQADWAEHVLLREGIVFAGRHRWHDDRAPAWAGRHADPVPAWADRKKGGDHGE